MTNLEKLSDVHEQAKKAYEMYLRILNISEANNGRITLALKDNYRQSGRLNTMSYSVAFDTGKINSRISIFDDQTSLVEYNVSEIIDVF
jgi:C4-type Zn-finger protein